MNTEKIPYLCAFSLLLILLSQARRDDLVRVSQAPPRPVHSLQRDVLREHLHPFHAAGGEAGPLVQQRLLAALRGPSGGVHPGQAGGGRHRGHQRVLHADGCVQRLNKTKSKIILIMTLYIYCRHLMK